MQFDAPHLCPRVARRRARDVLVKPDEAGAIIASLGVSG